MSSTPSASPPTLSSHQPSQYRIIGVVLAVSSGVLIGSSFVFKKKGLLDSQKGGVAGEGVAYLMSPMWWTGMILMILGELCNFAAYAFVEAIIVTPLGALSVVISALLSHFILHEKLSLFGWISSAQCLLGAAILALNGPQEQSVSTIEGFKHLFVAPGFLSYGGAVLVVAAVLAFWAAPRWGKQSMMPHLGVCSLIGGLSVSCTQGLGTCIVTSVRGDNQFKNWFIYFLLFFVLFTLLTEIYFLNVALAMFNTAMVTPTYYVTFTFCTLVTSIILYQGLTTTASQIITVVLAFVVICTGIFILQLSKVDEQTLLLLDAARQDATPHAAAEAELPRTSTLHAHLSIGSHARSSAPFADDAAFSGWAVGGSEKHATTTPEEPGLDALRGTFGAMGTLIRARRRAAGARSSASVHSQDAVRGSSGGAARHRRTFSGRSGSASAAGVGCEVVPAGGEKGDVEVRRVEVALPWPARSHSRGRTGSASGAQVRSATRKRVASPTSDPERHMRRGRSSVHFEAERQPPSDAQEDVAIPDAAAAAA